MLDPLAQVFDMWTQVKMNCVPPRSNYLIPAEKLISPWDSEDRGVRIPTYKHMQARGTLRNLFTKPVKRLDGGQCTKPYPKVAAPDCIFLLTHSQEV